MDQGKAAEPQHASALIALQWQWKPPVKFPKSFYSAQSNLCTIFKRNLRLLLAQAVPPSLRRTAASPRATGKQLLPLTGSKRRAAAHSALTLASQLADWSCFHGTDGVQRNTGDIYLHQASKNQSQQSKRLPEKTL